MSGWLLRTPSPTSRLPPPCPAAKSSTLQQAKPLHSQTQTTQPRPQTPDPKHKTQHPSPHTPHPIPDTPHTPHQRNTRFVRQGRANLEEMGEGRGSRVEGAGYLNRNVQWFRGGLVFKVDRLLHHSAPGLRAIKEKEVNLPTTCSRMNPMHMLSHESADKSLYYNCVVKSGSSNSEARMLSESAYMVPEGTFSSSGTTAASASTSIAS